MYWQRDTRHHPRLPQENAPRKHRHTDHSPRIQARNAGGKLHPLQPESQRYAQFDLCLRVQVFSGSSGTQKQQDHRNPHKCLPKKFAEN